MTKWEYCVLENAYEYEMNNYGKDGWELVAIDSSYDGRRLWLKRPITEPKENE